MCIIFCLSFSRRRVEKNSLFLVRKVVEGKLTKGPFDQSLLNAPDVEIMTFELVIASFLERLKLTVYTVCKGQNIYFKKS